MAVWPPKLVSVTLYPSLTSTLSSTALTPLSSRVRGVGQWKAKEEKIFSATCSEQKKGIRRKWRLSGHIRDHLPDAGTFFLQRRKCLEDSSPSPTLTTHPQTRAEKPSPANNTGRRVPGPNCMLTERWDEAGLNRERR